MNALTGVSAAYYGAEDGTSTPFSDFNFNQLGIRDGFSGGSNAIPAAASISFDTTSEQYDIELVNMTLAELLQVWTNNGGTGAYTVAGQNGLTSINTSEDGANGTAKDFTGGYTHTEWDAADILAAIDAESRFSAEYYGSEDGTSIPYDATQAINTGNTQNLGNFAGGEDADPITVTIDNSAQTVTVAYAPSADGILTSGDTLGDIKTVVDAEAALSSMYFGGDTATEDADRAVSWSENFDHGADFELELSAFTLGPEENVFGSPSATRSEAEEERDDYAAANPNWEPAYEGKTDCLISLIFSTSTIFQTLDDNGIWRDVTFALIAETEQEAADLSGKADVDLQNIETNLTAAEQRVVLDRIGEILDATAGFPQPGAAYLGRVGRNLRTGEEKICVNLPHVSADGEGDWTEVTNADLAIGDKNTVDAVVDEYLYDPVDDHFYAGVDVFAGTPGWVGDTAQDALTEEVTTAGNTVHWLGQHHSDSAALRQITALASNTDYFYYRRSDHTIRKLTLNTYVAPGSVENHYYWVHTYGNLLGTYITPDASGDLRDPTEKDWHEFRMAFDGLQQYRVVRELHPSHGASADFSLYTHPHFKGVWGRDNQIQNPVEGDYYYNHSTGHWREYNFVLADFRERWFNIQPPGGWRGEWHNENEALANINGNNQLVVYRATPHSLRRVYRSSNFVAAEPEHIYYTWGPPRPPPDVAVHVRDVYQLNEDSEEQHVDGSGNYEPADDVVGQVLTTGNDIDLTKVTVAVLFNSTFSAAQDYEIMIASLNDSDEIDHFYLHGTGPVTSVDQTTIQELEFELRDPVHIEADTKFIIGIVNPSAGQSFVVYDDTDSDSLGDAFDSFESDGVATLPLPYDLGDSITAVAGSDLRFKLEYSLVNEGIGNVSFLDVPTKAQAEDYEGRDVFLWTQERVGQTAVAAVAAEEPETIFADASGYTDWEPSEFRDVTLTRALTADDSHRRVEIKLRNNTNEFETIHEHTVVRDWLDLPIKSTGHTAADTLSDLMAAPIFAVVSSAATDLNSTLCFIARGSANNNVIRILFTEQTASSGWQMTLKLV